MFFVRFGCMFTVLALLAEPMGMGPATGAWIALALTIIWEFAGGFWESIRKHQNAGMTDMKDFENRV
jgi:hypothetical protein